MMRDFNRKVIWERFVSLLAVVKEINKIFCSFNRGVQDHGFRG